MRPVLYGLGHDRAGLTAATPRAPGELMLHPAMVLAVGVLALNDHWLKTHFGTEPGAGVVTGKLSDVAGLAFFPALLVSVVEVARWALRRDRGGWACGRRELAVAMAVTAAGFAAVQTVPVAAAGYEAVLAVLRWCPAGVAAGLGGEPWPSIPQVGHVMDASDILCVPAVLASDWEARRTGGHVTAGAMVTTGDRASGT
jgi:hypothetical protein